MRRQTYHLSSVTLVATLLLVAFHMGCSGCSVATEPSEESAAESTGQAAVETFPVPEKGTPEEYLAFLEQLAEKEPPARDQESLTKFVTKLGHTVIVASDRILAAKPSEKVATEAVQYKLAGIGLLEQAGDKSAQKIRDAMPAELEAAGYTSLVRPVKVDGYFSRFQGMGNAKKEEFLAFAKEFAGFLEEGTPDPQEIGLAMRFADVLEQVLDAEDAAAYYERCGKVFAGQEDEQIAEMAAMMAGAARRLRLIDNEMPLEGITLDGKELDWDEYKGKVVLVDFWATWCGPCIQEIGNILQNYEKYHDRGFEVVGINVDEERSPVKAFLKNRNLPWTVVYDDALKDAGRETMAARYGVRAYPTVMLVGRDGKVAAMQTYGPELGPWIEELLAKPVPASPATETAPKESAKTKPVAAAEEEAAKSAGK